MPTEVSREKSTLAPPPPPFPPPPPPPDPEAASEVPLPVPPAPPAFCANCAARLGGPYCALCGQHVADFHRSVWQLVVGFFDNVFCWDNKLFRTLDPLLAQPGELTREFMIGRRVRYVHPLRLFLFTSAVCLTLLQFTHHGGTRKGADSNKVKTQAPTVDFHPGTGDEDDSDDDEDGKPARSPVPLPVPSVQRPTAPVPPVPPVPPGAATPATPAASGTASPAATATPADAKGKRSRHRAGPADAAVERLFDQVGKQVEEKVKAKGSERFAQEVAQNVQSRLSWVSLALLPLFALMLRAVYWRRGDYYFEHLIFSLHYHTFLLMFWVGYSWLSIVAEFTGSGALKLCAVCALLVPAWYLYQALRRVYGEGARRTGFKVFVLGGMHLLVLLAGLSIVGLLSLLKTVNG